MYEIGKKKILLEMATFSECEGGNPLEASGKDSAPLKVWQEAGNVTGDQDQSLMAGVSGVYP